VVLGGPVIDISRLPRYGMLAPPLPRQRRVAGQLVAYDRTTSVFTRNRGLLQEALENKSGGRDVILRL
jgi:nephrocystin-4